MKRVIRIQTSGGKVPPQAMQQLQAAGLNAQEVANEISERIKAYSSLGLGNLNVEIEYDDSSKRVLKYAIDYPPITTVLLKIAGKDSPSHQAGKEIIGDVPIEKLMDVVLMKWEELSSKSVKAALKQVVSACRSIGLTVNGKDPKVVVKEIDQGAYDDLISKYEEKVK